jgi:hypothetical protein
MDTEKPRKQVSYSLTTPAVPLTVIVIYHKGKKDDDLDPVVVVSETMPVLACAPAMPPTTRILTDTLIQSSYAMAGRLRQIRPGRERVNRMVTQ